MAQLVLEGQLYRLEYLGYEGPAPKTFHEANTLIEELLRTQPDEPNNTIIYEGYELSEDGFTASEIEYARMMHLRKKKEGNK